MKKVIAKVTTTGNRPVEIKGYYDPEWMTLYEENSKESDALRYNNAGSAFFSDSCGTGVFTYPVKREMVREI